MRITGLKAGEEVLRSDGMELEAETRGVLRDEHGVPVEWTLLRIGENPLIKNGESGTITLTAEDASEILGYYREKGESIPVDSNHYLHELASRKGLDECEVLKLVPSGVAAMGYGDLSLSGDDLRFRVKWTPLGHELMKEKIFKYFSPALRGLTRKPLRITSVAMENEPAINRLEALAAGANKTNWSEGSDGKESMSKLAKALGRLLGRDGLALGAETKEEERDKLACEVDEKASLIEQVKTLLGLEAGAGIDEVIAALRAETEKAKSADEKQVKLDELAEERAYARAAGSQFAEKVASRTALVRTFLEKLRADEFRLPDATEKSTAPAGFGRVSSPVFGRDNMDGL